MILPLAKSSDIVVQELGNELLVYDLVTNKAYRLNETSMIIFNACDGKTSFDELNTRYKFTADLVYLTLDQLKDEGLVNNYQSKFNGVSRREVIRKVGLTTMLALPVISGLVAPTSAAASSLTDSVCATPGGTVCGTPDDCTVYCQTNFVSSCTCTVNCCVECPNPNTVCNNVCVNTQTDSTNCGGCGIVCGNLQTCTNGICTPVPL